MIKLTRYDDGSGYILEIGTRTSVYFNNDWKQIVQIGHCNWYSFHLAYLYFEIDEMSKHYELVCILFGLGFTLRYNRDFEHSEMKQIAEEAWEQIKAGQVVDIPYEKEEEEEKRIMDTFVLLAGAIIVFGVGIGSFVCGWMACLSHTHQRRMTTTREK